MPLPAAAPRELIHTRQIECRGFRREDGLWDVEGHLIDTKTYDFKNDHRGAVVAGEPIHEMWLRLTLDDTMTIQGVEAATDHSPFAVCPAIIPNFQRLKGLGIGKGFINKVRELLGGVEGCTHLVEMIGPVATTAFQTIFPYRNRMAAAEGKSTDASRKPRLLNTCHAFAEGGEIAQRLWPELKTQGKS
jgi:Protein of unknown function (DUF2889)